jgi:hypothetical protein
MLVLLLALPGCLVGGRGGRGGGGGGGGGDDDSAADDDDGADDDDDLAGDDDTGDDDDLSGPPEEVVASGSWHQWFDWNNYIETAQNWEDCERSYPLVSTTHVIEPGCPDCRFLMTLDSQQGVTSCDGIGFVDVDPLSGMQFGITSSQELWYWSYSSEEWTLFFPGEATLSSFAGSGSTWSTYNPGWWDNDQPFEIVNTVELDW